ncbi:MAG TPA: SDR family NAD(P)-dependent oxidoreductase [Gaiellaceae bacterium]|jgi:NAD(P)-dependent dehydrogenase (short-subunit alcohol dehydrogenase family)|nr:SDR family NAD(P)-dependent oxidoreductase [Gaiellaceae bacterium]
MTRAALVTGTNRGLGRGIAVAFAEAGYRVASLNRTLAGDDERLGEIECDVSSPSELERGFRLARERLGGLDVCVASAGIRRRAPAHELAREEWLATLETNLTSVLELYRLVREDLRDGGDFVVVGSQAAREQFEGGAAYSASKAALAALAEVILLETRELDFRLTLVTPGPVRNRADDPSPYKMAPLNVGRAIVAAVEAPRDVTVAGLDLRPTRGAPSPVVGIERLQYT